MMHLSSLLLTTGLAPLGLAAYSIKDDYSAHNFFNMFTFDTYDDPTHGYVNYVDQARANSLNLYHVSNGQVTWGVDHANAASGRGRNSIRLTSKAQYTHGLVILDIAHMPASVCGVWPAFWMTGPNWPHSGEIDILEGVNTGTQNQMTMHTSAGCTLANANCEGGLGCAIKPAGINNYGTNLNNAGGGVYATEWTSAAVNIWFFPRHSIPTDISISKPNPWSWGPATARFVGGPNCNIDQHFMNNHIVFDTTFCGDWAGAVWAQEGTCAALAGGCHDYVRDHPEAFGEAYWTVNSLRVYSQDALAVREEMGVPVAEKNATVATTRVVGGETSLSSAIREVTTSASPPHQCSATTTIGFGEGNFDVYPRSLDTSPTPAAGSSPKRSSRIQWSHHHKHAGTEDKDTITTGDLRDEKGVVVVDHDANVSPAEAVVARQRMSGDLGRHVRHRSS
ncbi:MAG: hypothetical protein L6R40_006763 [Gallowayella cf. fulva]|nr:MAG: hypothetical protein L6R40_006763 [Xanthomendoza cf. fulva]